MATDDIHYASIDASSIMPAAMPHHPVTQFVLSCFSEQRPHPPHTHWHKRSVDIKSYALKARLEAHVDSIVSHVRRLLPYAYVLWTMECFFKLSGKGVFFKDLRVGPAAGPVELDHDRIAGLQEDLVNPVLVGVELQQAAVAPQAHGVQCAEHLLGFQGGVAGDR